MSILGFASKCFFFGVSLCIQQSFLIQIKSFQFISVQISSVLATKSGLFQIGYLKEFQGDRQERFLRFVLQIVLYLFFLVQCFDNYNTLQTSKYIKNTNSA